MRPDYCYDARITRIIDGDTYEVEVDLGFRMIALMPLRLAHVDCPERFTWEGKVAIKYVTDLLGPLPASCVVHTHKPVDKYGRYLADVHLDDHDGGVLDLAKDLLAEGFAHPYEGGKKE